MVGSEISGDDIFKKMSWFFERHYDLKKASLTTSCTDALEMSAILLEIQPGNKIIALLFIFVSTVNASSLRSAVIKFADGYSNNSNVDLVRIETLINNRTKAIVVVHYVEMGSCDMDVVMMLSQKYNIPVIEDAAQAIDFYYKEKLLGSIGAFRIFPFHETKNIISGKGGMLVINDDNTLIVLRL